MYSSIDLTESGMIISVNDEHNLNMFFPKLIWGEVINISFNFVHSVNGFLFIRNIDGWWFIFNKYEQFAKHPELITVTCGGIVISVNDEHLAKALHPISYTEKGISRMSIH